MSITIDILIFLFEVIKIGQNVDTQMKGQNIILLLQVTPLIYSNTINQNKDILAINAGVSIPLVQQQLAFLVIYAVRQLDENRIVINNLIIQNSQIMGLLDSRVLQQKKKISNLKGIEDIYSMFQQSNKVIIAVHNQNSPLSASRIKNLDNLISQLLEPFLQQQKYSWGREIFTLFKKSFTKHFEEVWSANREQFYQLLLLNCNVKVVNKKRKSFQDFFYDVAVHQLEETIPCNYIQNGLQQQRLNLMNASILMNGNGQSEMNLPLFIPPPQRQSRVQVEVQMTQFLRTAETLTESSSRSDQLRQRVQNSSLLLPETVFIDRLSSTSEVQVSDLLKYYNQFVNTANQLFYSNNLISCPLKHFVFSIQQKILRKKIKNTQIVDAKQTSSNEQARKIRKTRQLNNNLLLYEVKSFLQAYTTFVWMYLQLHLMEESRLGKIINSEILYGIIFKSVWGFVDWITQRGYQFEQSKLQEYYKSQQIKNDAKLSSDLIKYYSTIMETLRNEKHPQQYLKKVVIFYRQVSRNCQNADQLLLIYQQILSRSIKTHGSKQLYLFRMRNIIQKLLKIDQNSMSGGQISYSWTTWCILIELLREKINYRYGNLIISKGSFNNGQAKQTASFALEQSIVRNYQ